MVQADMISYSVDGVLAITGNHACAGLCVEALSFSFVFQWAPIPPESVGGATKGFNYVGSVAPGSSQVISAGPLTPFHFDLARGDYMSFFNAAGDEIDIYTGMGPAFATNTPEVSPPLLSISQLWDCHAETPSSTSDRITVQSSGAGVLTTTVHRIPEPTTLLLGLGFAGVAGARRARWI